MTTDELKQQLAQEMLVRFGIGLVSYRTYREILRLIPQCVKADGLRIDGIRLFISPFIEDGKILPFERWDLRPAPSRIGGGEE